MNLQVLWQRSHSLDRLKPGLGPLLAKGCRHWFPALTKNLCAICTHRQRKNWLSLMESHWYTALQAPTPRSSSSTLRLFHFTLDFLFSFVSLIFCLYILILIFVGFVCWGDLGLLFLFVCFVKEGKREKGQAVGWVERIWEQLGQEKIVIRIYCMKTFFLIKKEKYCKTCIQDKEFKSFHHLHPVRLLCKCFNQSLNQ